MGILYLCTPFSRVGADILEELGVAAYKTGSGELTNLPLIEHIARKGKPMIVSTGMCTIEEVGETVALLKKLNTPFALTHCVSAYPTPYDRVNLGMIGKYRELFSVPVGLSDHSRGIYTAIGAVALGACVVEKHFTLDRQQPGPDHPVSIEPDELRELVTGVDAVFRARGADREIFPEEQEIVAWARESVVSEVPIPRGSVITKEMVWVKRPSPGPGVVAAKDLGKVIGKVAQVDIPKDSQIRWEQLNAMKPRKIAVVSEARATYGYIKNVMHLIERSEQLELQLIVTGMHLLKEYGSSIDEILRDGFKPAARVDMYVGGDTPTAWSKSLGVEIQGLAQVFDMLKPDLLLVAGDRAEILAATVTAAYMNIPVAHIQSGDLSGHIDGSARHAITKLAHIHLPACEDSAERVRKMGEESWRIFNVGAPQLDDVVHGKKLARPELSRMFGVDFDQPVLLIIQHAVLAEVHLAKKQMEETLAAVKDSRHPALVIYPNVDAAGQEIISVIRQYEQVPTIKTFKNVERECIFELADRGLCFDRELQRRHSGSAVI